MNFDHDATSDYNSEDLVFPSELQQVFRANLYYEQEGRVVTQP